MLYGKLKEYRLLITFPSVSDAIKAERRLAQEGYDFATIPTPKELTAGCGLSICLPLEKQNSTEILLNAGIRVDGVYEAQDSGYLEINTLKNDAIAIKDS